MAYIHYFKHLTLLRGLLHLSPLTFVVPDASTIGTWRPSYFLFPLPPLLIMSCTLPIKDDIAQTAKENIYYKYIQTT